MQISGIHYAVALARATKAGIQHINHQVVSKDNVLRSYYFLSSQDVSIVFGPRPPSDVGRSSIPTVFLTSK
jgi:2,3-dihydroxy-p-cumate/2,3-dihydroxybenzoate 3,4-dioxygenase